MEKTIVEKIISSRANKEVKAGDIVVVNVDLAMAHDSTGYAAIKAFLEYEKEYVKDSSKIVFVIDHASPAHNEKASNIHAFIRGFARSQGIDLYDVGEGICHQVMIESKKLKPGMIVVGADSHTCTYGALNLLSFGVGSTDMSAVFLTGKLWLKVPRVVKVILNGKLPEGVYSKDIILYLIKLMGSYGAEGKALEFKGTTLRYLDMSDRFTICNMVIECGAVFGVMEIDEIALSWFKRQGINDIRPVYDDEDARFYDVIEIDVSELTPQVACPHSVSNVKPLRELLGKKVDYVFIGTCTNGRLKDLKIAAEILKDKKVCKDVRLIICPASKSIYLKAMELGLIRLFLEAGALVIPPGCGPCCGTHLGVPADGEVVLSTANRNFKGRMGNNKAFIYLASPAVCAASAITGRITDPKSFL